MPAPSLPLPSPCLPSPCRPLPKDSPGSGDPCPLGGQGSRWPGQEAAQGPGVQGRDGREPHRVPAGCGGPGDMRGTPNRGRGGQPLLSVDAESQVPTLGAPPPGRPRVVRSSKKQSQQIVIRVKNCS